MTQRNVSILALVLGGVGALFFVLNGFDVFPENVGLILGMVFVISAGILWAVKGQLEK